MEEPEKTDKDEEIADDDAEDDDDDDKDEEGEEGAGRDSQLYLNIFKNKTILLKTIVDVKKL